MTESAKTMRAVRRMENGDPTKVLKVLEVPVPEPGLGEVLVRVSTASVNPIDYKIINGMFPIKGEVPAQGWGTGSDFSGTIEKLGEGVTNFKVGDQIMANGLRHDPIAEYAVIPAYKAVNKPANMPVEQA